MKIYRSPRYHGASADAQQIDGQEHREHRACDDRDAEVDKHEPLRGTPVS